MGHGGGTIKFKLEGVMLFALALAICMAPLSEGLTNQNTDQNAINNEIKNQQLSNTNSIGNAASPVQVNAVKKYKKYKTYKKYRKYKTYKKYRKYKTYKKYRKYKKYKYKRYWSSKYHKYIYVRAAYTYRYTIRYVRSGGKGTGDCWTNSEILFQQLKKAGYKVRIIQYASSWSPRHRSVQTYQNGKWVNYNYKANGYKMTYWATSGSSHGKVIKTS